MQSTVLGCREAPILSMKYNSLEYRRLSSDWQEPLKKFFRSLVGSRDIEHFHPHSFTDQVAEYLANYSGPDLYYIIAEGKTVLGYGMLRGWEEGHETPSLGIIIDSSVRGIGLGKSFMYFLHSVAHRKGANRIRLKVYPNNIVAIRLYEDLGYRFTEEEAGQLVGVYEL